MPTKRMLIDSSHAEETRVVVATGTRLDEFDFETSTRKQLKGNIYLAKVTRVEPSLQAAFVDYGGNRHGFLPFSEIHPDYYQIPLADREALFREQEAAAEEEEAAEAAEAEAEAAARQATGGPPSSADESSVEPNDASVIDAPPEELGADAGPGDFADEPGYSPSEPWDEAAPAEPASTDSALPRLDDEDGEPPSWAGMDSLPPPQISLAPSDDGDMEAGAADIEFPGDDEPRRGDDAERAGAPTGDDSRSENAGESDTGSEIGEAGSRFPEESGDRASAGAAASVAPAHAAPAKRGDNGSVEEVGGDEIEDVERRRAHVSRSLLSRRYKIQEVIKKRQIMLVQVVKEERGTKGAALTTYLSLAGRYCVLMPNAIRGGGISRKIVNAEDRRRLKSITSELEVPGRMGLIVRTAGMNRTKAEIKRDFEYLLRQWESIRDLTLGSTAPCLIYGEANLIRRSIRDLYAKEIDEILVEGDEGYRIAKDFMRTLIPSHTSKVQPYRDRVPLFVRYQIESQLDLMYSPQVQLRSGGYLVINQTEALVAIDVNSGRATKERNIEETAFRTNLEAADEVARQLRLRDLAGLIVIDFIDMDESRNQRAVERRLKEALKTDRARIQVGRISPFGLLEMSRQRLRPSLAEASMESCAACGGTGMLRSTESAALHVLRAIEEEGLRGRAAEIRVRVPGRVAMYILNNKRQALADIEARYAFLTAFAEDNTLVAPGLEIERVRARGEGPPPLEAHALQPVTAETTEFPPLEEEVAEPGPEAAEVEVEEAEQPAAAEPPGAEAEPGGGRRRRRRKRGRGFEGTERPVRPREERAPGEPYPPAEHAAEAGAPQPEHEIGEPLEKDEEREPGEAGEAAGTGEDEASRAARRRRRGRRGGRRRRGRGGVLPAEAEPSAAAADEAAAGVAPGANGGDEDEESRERGRRRRRRGRRGRPGMGEAAGPGAEAQPGEDVGGRPRETFVPAEPASWAGGPPLTSDEIRVETGAVSPPVKAPPARPLHAADAAPARAADEMEEPLGAPDEGGAASGGAKPEPSGPPRRGWWQRVLTGR